MRESLAKIFQGIADRPPVLWALFGGIISAAGGQIEVLKPYEPLAMIVIPVAFGGIASKFTIGAKTGGKVAEAVIESSKTGKPPDAEAVKSAQVIQSMPNVKK